MLGRKANGRYGQASKTSVPNHFLLSVTGAPDHLVRAQGLRRLRSGCVSKFVFLSISCPPLVALPASPPPPALASLSRLPQLPQGPRATWLQSQRGSPCDTLLLLHILGPSAGGSSLNLPGRATELPTRTPTPQQQGTYSWNIGLPSSFTHSGAPAWWGQ